MEFMRITPNSWDFNSDVCLVEMNTLGSGSSERSAAMSSIRALIEKLARKETR